VGSFTHNISISNGNRITVNSGTRISIYKNTPENTTFTMGGENFTYGQIAPDGVQHRRHLRRIRQTLRLYLLFLLNSISATRLLQAAQMQAKGMFTESTKSTVTQ
jgi:Leucine-rich repeat (LRR) protein